LEIDKTKKFEAGRDLPSHQNLDWGDQEGGAIENWCGVHPVRKLI
jgi:hypothetical protein